MSFKELLQQAALEIMQDYHVRLIENGTKLSVLVYYNRQIDELIIKHKLELHTCYHLDSGQVQGILQIPS